MRRPNTNEKNNKNLHRGDYSEKNDKRKRSIKTQWRPGAGSRSRRVSSSSRWSRRLHDGGMHTQTRAHSNAHARNSDRLRPALFYKRTRMHTNTHTRIRTHTHTYETTPTLPIKRRPVSLATLSAASECLPRCYRAALSHGNIRTHVSPAAVPHRRRRRQANCPGRCSRHDCCEDHRQSRHPDNIRQ